MPACCPTEITKDETDIYDRQIRLWGLDAQNRLRNSSVLLVGLSGLGAEVAKNLMLCGLKSLTMMDDKELSREDEYAQFLTTPDHIGKNRAEASRERTRVLNPLVELNVLTESVAEKPDEYFQQFDLVVLIDQKYSVVDRVDKICRKANIRFLAGGVFGWLGYGFSDFNGHTFLVPKQKEQSLVEFAENELPGEPSPKKAKTVDEAVTIEDEADQQVKVEIPFPSFEDAMNVNWGSKKHLRKVKRVVPQSYYPLRALLKITDTQDEVDGEAFVAAWKEELEKAYLKEQAEAVNGDDVIYYMNPQLSPVAAVVGGVIGQEAIKALSQKDAPLKNLFIYSAMDTTGIVCDFPPSS